MIDVTKATTEFNTIFETVLSVSEQVDPIKLNQTLAATAEALDGLGDRFGESIVHGDEILADINPQMPQIRRDNRSLADLGAVYANAAPDLFDGLENVVTTARTLNEQQGNIDQALMAAIGFGNTGGDVFERGGPYLVRGAADLIPTSGLLDEYSPELFCTIRNYSDADIKAAKVLGGNGYSSNGVNWIMGAGNPYVYPDNLPRARRRCRLPRRSTRRAVPRVGPAAGNRSRATCGRRRIVMDTGASLAPYNHLGLGQPLLIDYVWGRQVGENTINP